METDSGLFFLSCIPAFLCSVSFHVSSGCSPFSSFCPFALWYKRVQLQMLTLFQVAFCVALLSLSVLFLMLAFYWPLKVIISVIFLSLPSLLLAFYDYNVRSTTPSLRDLSSKVVNKEGHKKEQTSISSYRNTDLPKLWN